MLYSNESISFNMKSSVLNKVLYGLSIDESLDITDRFRRHVLNNNNVIVNNTNIKKISADLYPNNTKKLFIFENNNTIPLIFRESDNKIIIPPNKNFKKICAILHLGDIDMWDEMMMYLKNFGDTKYDLWVTILEEKCDNVIVDKIKSFKHNTFIISVKNEGFDIGPFFKILRIIKTQNINYDYLLKIHTKNNTIWRTNCLMGLIGSGEHIKRNLYILNNNPMIGSLCHMSYLSNIKHDSINKTHIDEIIKNIYGATMSSTDYKFMAGTMFWMDMNCLNVFTINIINWILSNINNETTYDRNWMEIAKTDKIGNVLWKNCDIRLRDGMFEHALERIFGFIVQKNNKSIYGVSYSKQTTNTSRHKYELYDIGRPITLKNHKIRSSHKKME